MKGNGYVSMECRWHVTCLRLSLQHALGSLPRCLRAHLAREWQVAHCLFRRPRVRLRGCLLAAAFLSEMLA